LFPILKRQNESVAVGYVASRVLESTIIVVGLISLLSVLTLRQKYAGVGGRVAVGDFITVPAGEPRERDREAPALSLGFAVTR
jgi:Domain of unknown function (DUF4386)